MSQEKGRPLPKFGDWDVNDPASAEGFTVIFNKARDEKKTGGTTSIPAAPADSPAKNEDGYKNQGSLQNKAGSDTFLKWEIAESSAVEAQQLF